MSRRGASRPRLAGPAALLLLALLAPAGAGAQDAVSSPQVTGIEMTGPVRAALKQIEEQWLQWIVQNDKKQAEGAVADLLATARQIGMGRLPDLSAGAAARAVQRAREKDFPRAAWALAASERFDPGNPETAFAAVTVARLEGKYGRAVAAFARGCSRLFNQPLESFLWLQDLLVWALTLLLVSGGLFIVVQVATKGGGLYLDLVELFARKLPRPVAIAVAVLCLFWPLALPYGLLWLPLLWSLLLWGYSSTSERVVLVALWLLVGGSPLLISQQRRQVELALSPPAQAMESLERRALYGGLFSDLGVLRSALPESVAVKHLLADVHRSLGQWELARALYRQVLEAEPDNGAALLNLGAYYYLKGDFTSAIQTFQKVVTADPKNAAALYNLSQAYSVSYLFDESRSALAQARAIDDARVSGWMINQQKRVVTTPGGFSRTPEIRRELRATWHAEEGASSRLQRFRRGLSLFVPLALILAALAIHLVRRSSGYTERPLYDDPDSGLLPWARALVPGLSAAEVGEGGRTFLSILLVAALLMLPLFGQLGYRIPWRYDPGNLASWIVAILGLSLYLGLRLRRELRTET
jgi:tetratricopeptide (TPR) repeat protein